MTAPAATMAIDHHARFQQLLESHRGIVFKIVHSYAWDPDDRDDLAQEILAQLWRAWPGYDPARTFSTWMYRIALNVAISHVRSASQHRRHAVALDEQAHDVADGQARDPDSEQQLRLLQRIIAGLDRLNRALLLLYLDGCGSREIAEVLGISESNVTTKISRLKQHIRSELS
jgi:RNA polymerase sigma-70 factor (ECF subfamily)